jgi:hypothetical protein
LPWAGAYDRGLRPKLGLFTLFGDSSRIVFVPC